MKNKIIVKSQFNFLYFDPTPNKVIVCCRGGGKTWGVTDWLIYHISTSPTPVIAIFFSSTLQTVKETVVPIMQRHLDAQKGAITFNKSSLIYTITLKNNIKSYIYLKSYENPNAKRGLHPDVIIMDEVSECPSSVFDLVIFPTLLPSIEEGKAKMIAIGTPRGKNQLYDLFNKGLSKNNKEWASYLLTASNSGLFSQTTLDFAKKMMSKEGYLQEMECDFDAATTAGTIYGEYLANYAIKFNRISDNYDYNPNLPVYTAWDIGHTNNTSIWFFQKNKDNITFIDFYENCGYDLSHYANELLCRPYTYYTAILPWDAATNNIRAPLTLAQQLQNFGIRNIVLPNESIHLGIDCARRLLKTCFFNKIKCSVGIEHLKLARFKVDEKKGIEALTPMHDKHLDGADAFRYAAYYLNSNNSTDKTTIIHTDYNVLY